MQYATVREMLDDRKDLRIRLFYMGFYATTRCVNFESEYPFYNNWKTFNLSDLTVYVHPNQNFHKFESDDISICLIGHAYNPFTKTYEEDEILKSLSSCPNDEFFSNVCTLTGVYTIIWKRKGYNWCVLGDACGMQTTYYTSINEHIHISSHDMLLGDLLSLVRDSYIEELVNYKFFGLFGAALPGDLSQYSEVKRLVPNHYIDFNKTVKAIRFHVPEIKKISYEEIVKYAADILHNNLEMISKKWSTPAISMTGGCDSKTTLACANGLYDNFNYFSYISSESELPDANAAHIICKEIVPSKEHKIFHISNNDIDYKDIELHRAILFYNCGKLRQVNSNDVRKRCFFTKINDFDVEIKSWASEIGRAYYSKRFNNRIKFSKVPNPRTCTTMYKVFLHNRKLVRKTDEIFKEYLQKYFIQSSTIPWQEQFFWEFRVSSWNGLVITGEHRYSFDITIPYNNCYLLEVLLSVPLKDRIYDKLYKDIREFMNPNIDSVGLGVQNIKHTRNRAFLENIYFTIHSKLPF